MIYTLQTIIYCQKTVHTFLFCLIVSIMLGLNFHIFWMRFATHLDIKLFSEIIENDFRGGWRHHTPLEMICRGGWRHHPPLETDFKFWLGGNWFAGADHALSRPCKRFFRGGLWRQPPLEKSFTGTAQGVGRPCKWVSKGGWCHGPPLEIDFQGRALYPPL